MTMPGSTLDQLKGRGQYPDGSSGGQGLSLQVQAAVQLATSMDRLSGVMEQEAERHRAINQAIHPFMIPVNTITISASAGTLNQPNLYGPQMSNYWDVRRIQVSGITAGTVTVYLNQPPVTGTAGAEVLAVLTSSGANTPLPQYFGSGQILLGGNDSLVFAATGITGTPLVSVSGIEIAAEWIGDYLL